jgi:hypothetical protein
MCVECGCEVSESETEEEVRDGESVVHHPAEIADTLCCLV